MDAPSDTEPADYALLNAVYLALLGGVAYAARDRDAVPARELVPLGAAAFALSKVLAREKIGSWVREPFVEQDEEHRPKRPRGGRVRAAVGELLTCTRCVGAWSGLAVVGLRLAAPGPGRAVTTVLATSAANDFLHAAFKALCEGANAAEAVSSATTPRERPRAA